MNHRVRSGGHVGADEKATGSASQQLPQATQSVVLAERLYFVRELKRDVVQTARIEHVEKAG